MSRFIFLMTPMCSSLLSSEYFSSRYAPVRLGPPYEALYVSKLALDKTTIRRCESLSVGGMGVLCSATSWGSDGGGSDWVPITIQGAVVSIDLCSLRDRKRK